jgi:hypothetical protein
MFFKKDLKKPIDFALLYGIGLHTFAACPDFWSKIFFENLILSELTVKINHDNIKEVNFCL